MVIDRIITQRLHLLKQLKTKYLIAAAVVFLFLLLLVAHPQPQTVRITLLLGLLASAGLGCAFLPKAPIEGFLSPLWSAVAGVSFFYLASLILMAFHSRQGSMELLSTYVDPSLSFLNYQEVSYGQSCQISHSTLYHSCFDLFALAHFLGWFFKTLICRDLKLIFFASVSFQLIEYSLRNVLNNFKECWWDHVVVDILGCNLLGIVCGFWVIDKFGLDRYRWSLRSAPLPYSHWENFKRFWSTWDLSALETKTFTSLLPFIKMVLFLVMFQVNDLTLFFLKYVWQVPPSHFLSVGRVWLVGLLCVNATREYYDFMKLRSKFRKMNLLLLISIILMQILLVVRQGKQQFQNAYIEPLGQGMLWSLVAMFLLFFVKILVSDVLVVVRRLKGNVEINRRIVQKMEYAKHIREL